MSLQRKVSLIAVVLASTVLAGAAMAGTANSTLTVDSTLVTACEVTPTSAIGFGSFNALASTGDQTANSGSTFRVACSNSASPTIYATGTRAMVNGSNSLPFNLSLTSGAASDDLPSTSGSAAALTVTQDGDLHDVVLYAKTAASDFKSLPSGHYTTNVTVSVAY